MENKPIRVLQVISSLYVGGLQSVVMNLYRNIDRSKIQFDFIIDHPEYDALHEEIEKLGGKIYVMPLFNGKNISVVKKAWNDFFVSNPEYKILHSHTRSYASIYIPIAKKYGLKTIIHSHSVSNGEGIKARIKDILQYPLRFQADYFFGCTKESGEWLFGKKVTNSNKFYILNNAIDTSKFAYNKKVRDEYRKKFDVENKKVFIQIGNFCVEKNHIFSIEMFSKLYQEDKNTVLFLVGDGEELSNDKARVDELNINGAVVFLGRRNDVNCLLQMADYYLMPSLFEGLSLAAVEAETSGIVCLFSDRITKDVKITDTCEFIPLEYDKWINTIEDKCSKRADKSNVVKEAGFDINLTSRWLKDFYERIISE